MSPPPDTKGKEAEEQGKNKGHRWEPGESGNPNGRPKKGYSITEMMKAMFEAEPDKKKQLGAAIFQKALEGDMTAAKTIWQYMDGMPKQAIEHTGEDGAPIDMSLSIVFVRQNGKEVENS